VAITITEALAEIKTIGKRIEKKRAFVRSYLVRDESRRDPLEKEGGSVAAIAATLQSIQDLEERIVEIRRLIAKANSENTIAIDNETRTIADWLTWRREVQGGREHFLAAMASNLSQFREKLRREGRGVSKADEKPREGDAIVCVDELSLAKEIDHLTDVTGRLDGLLSLNNARIEIGVDRTEEK